MPYQLHLAKHYCVITFPSTQYAMKAEKYLQDNSAAFIIIPTPRELTSGCGLSVKIFCHDLETMISLLAKGDIQYEGTYEIDKSAGSLTARVIRKTTS